MSSAVLVLAFAGIGCDSSSPEPQASTSASVQSVLRGKSLISQYQCGSCHTIPGVADARGVTAVSLEGFGRRSFIGGRIPNQPSALATWLIDPHSQVPAATMPSLAVSPAHAQDMANYLGTLR
ncbi:c-type cytochrome [Ottowia thiooxydans]|uniref:c-type cytochrome n=1 Tax=Ottowia thiooxydans TaxID=219182 RepID=UPI003395419A